MRVLSSAYNPLVSGSSLAGPLADSSSLLPIETKKNDVTLAYQMHSVTITV
jgi:hypothetical protein